MIGAGASGTASFGTFVQFVEQSDERRDTFHGNKQIGVSHRHPEFFVRLERAHDGGLNIKRQIAVARTETPIRMQPEPCRFGNDRGLARIRRTFHQGRARRTEHDGIERASRLHAHSYAFVGEPERDRHDRAGTRCMKVLVDSRAFKHKRASLETNHAA